MTNISEDSKKTDTKVICVGCQFDWREERVKGQNNHYCCGYLGTNRCECKECIKLEKQLKKEHEEEMELWSEFLSTFEEWKRSRS